MSLLTGISQGEPSRRDARSENYTRPSRMRPPVADESHPRFNVRDHRCVVCASPGNLGTTWDGDLPIGSGRGGHSWLLPSPWGRHPSLALHDDMLHDRNQGFLHLSKARKHCCMTLIMWSRLPLGENPWSWATTARVSCTAGQKVSRWIQLPSNSWELTRLKQETYVPASWSNPTPRPDKWFSVMEKAHYS